MLVLVMKVCCCDVAARILSIFYAQAMRRASAHLRQFVFDVVADIYSARCV